MPQDIEHIEELRTKAAKRLRIKPAQIPQHIAIVMDGNGRWATQRGKQRFEGHRQGARVVEKIALHCVDCGIECLTLYSFSMQNWKRPKLEVSFLMQLYVRYLVGIRKTLTKHNVRLVHLGRTEKLPPKLIRELHRTEEMSAGHTGMILALALNYGSREEIVDAVKKLCKKTADGKIKAKDIDEQAIADSLYTAKLPDPDLVIRTSNEMRISNFLLWQISYSEFYITPTLWPDFTPDDIDDAIIAFSKRSRRMGDIRPATV